MILGVSITCLVGSAKTDSFLNKVDTACGASENSDSDLCLEYTEVNKWQIFFKVFYGCMIAVSALGLFLAFTSLATWKGRVLSNKY